MGRFFGRSIHARNLHYDISVRPPVQAVVGTGVLGPFSLTGNRVAVLHLGTRVFLAKNHVRELKQRQRRRRRERHKFSYLVDINNSFARTARAVFTFVHFFAVVN